MNFSVIFSTKLRVVILCSFLIFSALVTLQAQALPEDVSKIFDKNQRRLSDPPSALRSDSTSSDSRYFSGMERLKQSLGAEGKEDRGPTATEDLEVVEPITPFNAPQAAPQDSSSRIVIVRDGVGSGEIRSEKRAARLSEYGFHGDRIFGVGFVGAGAYGIFGAEVDFGFGNDWSGGFGIGTGMAYATWGLHARKVFHKGNLTPYFQWGYANWFMSRDPFREAEIYPLYLGERFLQEKSGDYRAGKRVHLIYPALGLLYQSESGLAFMMHLQYLISVLDFKGALAGSFGLHFYF
jgi:hypothetical protein